MSLKATLFDLIIKGWLNRGIMRKASILKANSIIKINLVTLAFLVLFIPSSYASFEYKEWRNKTEFTDFGREVQLTIKAQVKLNQNQYYDHWSFNFGKDSDVSIKSVYLNNRQTKYSFRNNKLTVNLPKYKNGKWFNVIIKYIKNEDFNSFIRSESVSIPDWVAGARGTIITKYPSNMTVYSEHPNSKFEKYKHQITWMGTVPNNGYSDIVRMTLKEGRWKVSNRTIIEGKEKFKNIEVTVPVSFRDGNHIIEKLKADISPKNVSGIDKEDLFYVIKYQDADSNEIYFDSKAIIRNGENFSKNLSLNRKKYLLLKDDEVFLKGVMNEIYKSEFYDSSQPLHKIISKWAYNHIQYDIGQFGREISVKDIYKYKRGVCSHYAKIFVALCRYNKIPALEINGVAYDTENAEFTRHAWALVNYQGKWIPVDPTWNITSGLLPISHIFFSVEGCNFAKYLIRGTYNDRSSIKIKWDFDIEWKGENLN